MESNDKSIGVQLTWPIKQPSIPPIPATPSTEDGQRAEQSNSKKRKTSDIWNHFTKNKDGVSLILLERKKNGKGAY
jgi:hypothetical protein